jgi:hypothetical protein
MCAYMYSAFLISQPKRRVPCNDIISIPIILTSSLSRPFPHPSLTLSLHYRRLGKLLLWRPNLSPNRLISSLQALYKLTHRSLLDWTLQLPMPSQSLIMPINLSSICLSMFLRVSLCSLYRSTTVDEKDGCHCKGGQGGGYCLLSLVS